MITPLHRSHRIIPALACALLATPARAQTPANPYVIVISVDGLGGTYLNQLLTRTDSVYPIPNFKRLRDEGTGTLAAHIDNNNWETLPNHTSIVTARPRDGTIGHNWSSNSDPAVGQTIHTNKGSYVAGVFDVVHDNGLSTGLYANKTKFCLFETYASYTGGGSYGATYGALDVTGVNNGRDKVDEAYLNTALGGIIVDTFIAKQKSGSPLRYAFLHINEPDSYGHNTGWGSAAWFSQVVVVDSMLGKIFKLVEQDVPALVGNTMIVLTADHGNQDNPPTPADRYAVPFYVWGPGVTAGADLYTLNPDNRRVAASYPMTTYTGVQPVRNAEANNLALDLLGLPAIPGSTFNASQDLVITAANNQIITFTFPGLGAATISGNSITMNVPYDTNVTALAPTYTLPAGTTCTPASGSTRNFSQPVHYIVTPAAGETRDYAVTVTVLPPAGIAINAGTNSTLAFNSLPAATEWSTASVAGASGDLNNDAGLDSAMSSIAASSITTSLATQTGDTASGTAYWRSGDLKLGTQPTGNKMTLLMATLRNAAAGTINNLTVSYALGQNATAPPLSETAATADPDRDGIPNAVEFVLGTDPRQSNTTAPLAVNSSPATLTFTFQRGDASETGDVNLAVQLSADLYDWSNPPAYRVGPTTATSSAGITVTENGANRDTVVLTIPNSLDGRIFARLRAMVSP